METMDKETLKSAFFAGVPKSRRIDPFFQSLFEFMYDAHQKARQGARVLNIYMSADLSGGREEVYRTHFFGDCELTSVDFAKDTFIYDGRASEPRHSLPFPSDSFDIIVTTKYILEHVSEPADVLAEISRVLKKGGQAYLVAAHVRRQHQKPYDFYRFSEFALEYLAKKAGFSRWEITPSDGAMYTLGMYSYFFQRGVPMPRLLERCFDGLYYYLIQPVFFGFHALDKGYGRDLSSYFLLKATK
jgi:SAM-dependent methyltransferase